MFLCISGFPMLPIIPTLSSQQQEKSLEEHRWGDGVGAGMPCECSSGSDTPYIDAWRCPFSLITAFLARWDDYLTVYWWLTVGDQNQQYWVYNCFAWWFRVYVLFLFNHKCVGMMASASDWQAYFWDGATNHQPVDNWDIFISSNPSWYSDLEGSTYAA